MAKTVQKTAAPAKSLRSADSKPLLKPLMLILALVSALIGMYVSLTAAFKTMGIENRIARSVGCTVNEWIDCEPVYATKSAYLLNVPVAAWGFAFFLAMALIAVFALIQKKEGAATAVMVGGVLAGFSTLFSIYKAFQLVEMGYLCVLCVSMYAAIVAILAFFLLSFERETSLGAFIGRFFKGGDLGFKPSYGAALALVGLSFGVTYLYFAGQEKKTEKAEVEATSPIWMARQIEAHFAQTPVKIEVPEGALLKGNPEAKVTIVEFADFQCPGCAAAYQTLEQGLKPYEKYVRFNFQNYPLDNTINTAMPRQLHAFAGKAAKSVVCATPQGKGWAMHHKLFDNQALITDKTIDEFAQSVGLDMGAYQTCMADPATTEKVKSEIERGKAAGVNSTPSVYINGRFFENWSNRELLDKVIQHELNLANVKK